MSDDGFVMDDETGTKAPTKKSKRAARQPLDVFYSWQSDLAPKVHRRRIRAALDRAANQLEQKGLPVSVHEATERAAGSPDIAEVIFSKIRNTDVFVADVSPVAKGRKSARSRRPVPNPNVLLETGYAISALGTERVVLVQNLDAGPITALPFDLAGKRLLTYRTNDPPNQLAGDLKRALRQVGMHPRATLWPDWLAVPQMRRLMERIADELGNVQELVVQWKKLIRLNDGPYGPHIKAPSLSPNLTYLEHIFDLDDCDVFFVLDVVIDTLNAQLSRFPINMKTNATHTEAVQETLERIDELSDEAIYLLHAALALPFPARGDRFPRLSDAEFDWSWGEESTEL